MHQTRFTFKHLDALDSIKDYAESRVGRLDKFALHKDAKVHFIFSIEKKDQVAEIMIDVGPLHYTATAKDEILYAAIDRVMDKIERQLSKQKEKIQNHHDYEHSKEGKLDSAIAAEGEEDEEN